MDSSLGDRISSRKREHLELAMRDGVEGPGRAGWEDVSLVHNCLPEVDMDEIDLRTEFMGCMLDAPVWITAMTGGHERASTINRRLAAAAERHGLAMGLGSQRAGLAVESLMATYRAARDAAPRAMLVANIGAPQLIAQGSAPPLAIPDVQRIVESIGAQALAIHLNFLQEVVQPEGERVARGCLAAIQRVVAGVSVPVLAKETGGGIARERARDLVQAGVAAIDVGGSGGTSMVRIEGLRASARDSVAAAFDGWGIPTAAAVLEVRDCGVPVVATGGIRSGVDAAKALALGAYAVGVGRPFLLAADAGEEELEEAISRFLRELRAAVFLTGCTAPTALRRAPRVLHGELRAWAQQRAS